MHAPHLRRKKQGNSVHTILLLSGYINYLLLLLLLLLLLFLFLLFILLCLNMMSELKGTGAI